MKDEIFKTLQTGLLPPINEVSGIVENWTALYVEEWNKFCEKQLYETYKKYEISKVFVISEKDFKRFLLWALPKWYKLNEEKENEKEFVISITTTSM